MKEKIKLLGLALFFLGLKILLAHSFPLTNDEAYYRQWGQSIFLSYLDHPPGVAYLAYLGQRLGESLLFLRLPGLILGELTLLTLLLATRKLWPALASKNNLLLYYLFLESTLGIGFLGCFLLPDIGLAFFLSLFVFQLLKTLDRDVFSVSQAFILGLTAGGAGIFKYHAAPLCLAALAFLAFQRKKSLKKDLNSWITLGLGGLVIISPVLAWNFDNHFASFKFQASHGFQGGSWHYIYLIQAALGLMVLVSPLGFIAWIRAFFITRVFPREKILIAMSLPLFILLIIAALRKPVLPHWFLPCFLVLSPLLYPFLKSRSRALAANAIFSLVLVFAAVFLFNSPRNQYQLVKTLGLKENPFAELTIWKPLSLEFEDKLSQIKKKSLTLPKQEAHCPSESLIYAYRWYAVAQLSYYLERKVFAFEKERASFYTYRDRNEKHRGCRIVLIYKQDQEKAVFKEKGFQVEKIEEIRPKGHESSVFLLAQGRIF